MKQHVFLRFPIMLFTILLLSRGTLQAEDLIEFLSGAKVTGRVVSIDKEKKTLVFEAKISNRTFKKTYAYSRIHAVTYKGKRIVFNEKSTPSSESSSTTSSTENNVSRSKAEVQRLIEQTGSTPPDWYEQTPINHPRSLDLSWPIKPPVKGWNNQKNMGQYIWDIINPNPSKWKSGTRLVHHIMSKHQSSPHLLQRDMKALGSMYFRFFEDYPRAAFWFQKAKVTGSEMPGILLAECYWRLGSKEMALEMIGSTKYPNMQSVKLLGDMHETEKALKLAESFRSQNQKPHALILAGDACRNVGRLEDAIEYYERVIKAASGDNNHHKQLVINRAKENMASIQLFDQANVKEVADGKYLARQTGFTGPIEVEVTVKNGTMTSVKVVRHTEKQFYSALTDTPARLIKKQSVKGIDTTSRATITSNAIINATAKALAQGKK